MGAHFPAVSRVLLAIEGVAAVLNAGDLCFVGNLAQVPRHEVVTVTTKVVALDRSFAGPEMIPLGDATLFATLRKDGPHATVKCPAAVCNARTPGTGIDTVFANVEALPLTRNLTLDVSRQLGYARARAKKGPE